MGHEIRIWAIDKQIILSKKNKPYENDGNILSKNWFSYLYQECPPKGPNQYLTIN